MSGQKGPYFAEFAALTERARAKWPADAQGSYEQMKEDLEALRGQVESAGAQIATLNNELAAARELVATGAAAVRQAQREREALTEGLADARRLVGEGLAALDERRRRCDEWEAEAIRLRTYAHREGKRSERIAELESALRSCVEMLRAIARAQGVGFDCLEAADAALSNEGIREATR